METFNLYSSFILESFLKLTRLCSWRSFLWVSVSFCNFLSNAEPFLFSPFFPTTSQSSSVYMIISCSCSFFMNFLPHPCRGSLYFTVNFLHGIFVTQTQDPLFRVLLWKQASSRHSFCSLFVSSQTLFGEFRRRLWFHEEFSCRQRLLAVFELEESQEEAKSLKGLTHKMHWVGKWSQSDVYCQETLTEWMTWCLSFFHALSHNIRDQWSTLREHMLLSQAVYTLCANFASWSSITGVTSRTWNFIMTRWGIKYEEDWGCCWTEAEFFLSSSLLFVWLCFLVTPLFLVDNMSRTVLSCTVLLPQNIFSLSNNTNKIGGVQCKCNVWGSFVLCLEFGLSFG